MTYAHRAYLAALVALLVALLLVPTSSAQPSRTDRPNIVVIFADDMGYGDIGVYGNPTIQTPHLDRMAAEGMKFTQFYSAASVCTPSRAALLTGRLPVRSGMASDKRRVLFPDSKYGLPHEEVTMAEVLKEQGYATAAVGKWHLGHLPEYLPTQHGFDQYFGIPYSNDMDRVVEGAWQGPFWDPKPEYWNVPLLRDTEEVERPVDQYTITQRYTVEAVDFVREHRNEPFFLYFAHSMPHVPLFASEAFAETSRRGLYGDVIEEIDWSVGQVLDAIREEELAENTLVFFTSDNGPWLIFGTHGGSAGPLRDGKGTTWEGGMREPAIAWWPGHVPASTVSAAVSSTLDLLPTAVEISGATHPMNRMIDGVSLLPVLQDPRAEVREEMPFYRGETLYAYRRGPWKAHFITQRAYLPDSNPIVHDVPELYHLEHDPSERHNIAAEHPDIVEAIRQAAERHRATIQLVPSLLNARIEE